MHPASRLAAFLVLAVFVQLARIEWVAFALAVIILLLAGHGRFAQFLRLVWRLKFVFAALVVVHVLAAPGDQVALPEVLYAWASATARVLLLLAALVDWVLSLPRERLLCGLLALLRMVEPLGIPAQRIGVRLMLTLEYATTVRARPWRELLGDVLQPSTMSDHTGTQTLLVPQVAWSWRDAALLTGALAAAMLAL